MKNYSYRAPSLNLKKMTKDDIVRLLSIYEEIYTELVKPVEFLEAEQDKFPVQVNPENEYDSLTLKASNLKHKSIQLMRDAITAHGNAEVDFSHAQSVILIDKADESLKDKGFEKVTDTLRQAAVANSVELREFEKVVRKLGSIKETVSRLARAFENDEFMFKEMAKKLNPMGL